MTKSSKSFVRNSLLGLLGLLVSQTILLSSVQAEEVVWKLSPGRSNIQFKVSHFVLMEVEGKFRASEATVVTPSINDFSNAKVQATIPVKSIYTGNEDRDEHLLQDVFFNQLKFPDMQFRSTKVVKKGDGKYQMHGELSIRGVTRPIVLDVDHVAHKVKEGKKARSKFKAVGKLNRYDYGLKWNDLTEAGQMVVGEEVDIELDIALIQDAVQSTVASLD